MSRLGVAAFVVGLIGFLLALLPVVGTILGIVAVVLALVALRGGRRGLPVAALVFGGLAAVGSTLMLIALLVVPGESAGGAPSVGFGFIVAGLLLWAVLAVVAALAGIVVGAIALRRRGAPARAARAAQQEALRVAEAAARDAQFAADRAAYEAQQAAARAAQEAQQAADRAAQDAQQAADRAAHEAQLAAKRAAAERDRAALEAGYAENLDRIVAAARDGRRGACFLLVEATASLAERLFGDDGRARLDADLARLRVPAHLLNPTALGDIETPSGRIRVFEEFVAVGDIAHDTTAGSKAAVDVDGRALSEGGTLTVSVSVEVTGPPGVRVRPVSGDGDDAVAATRSVGGRTGTVQFWSDSWDVNGRFPLGDLARVRLIVRRYLAHVDSIREAREAGRGKSVPERINELERLWYARQITEEQYTRAKAEILGTA